MVVLITCKNKEEPINKGAIVALNSSPVLCAPVLFSGRYDDLNHLVEGNQAGLFRSIVFERITRPYPLPPPHTNIFYIPNIKARALVVSYKKVFHVFPKWASVKHVTPRS